MNRFHNTGVLVLLCFCLMADRCFGWGSTPPIASIFDCPKFEPLKTFQNQQDMWFNALPGSYDPDNGEPYGWGNGIVEYEWSWPPQAYDPDYSEDHHAFRCKFNANGKFKVRVRVKDDEGVWSAPADDLEKWATCTVYVFTMDLDISGVSEASEENPGGYVAENDDDDNLNDEADKDDYGEVDYEYDLIAVYLSYEPSTLDVGYAELNSPYGGQYHIRVWTHDDKRTMEIGDSDEKEVWPIASMPSTRWVEGYSAGTVDMLRLHFTPDQQVYPGGTYNHDLVQFTVIDVDFQEDTGQSYGFDAYTDVFLPYKSVKASDTDKCYAQIFPTGQANKVYFKSSNTNNVSVSPTQASGSAQQLTFAGGAAQSSTDVWARLTSVDGIDAALIYANVYFEDSYTLAIRVVHEDDDDEQDIPVGQGSPNETAITAGINGALDTTPSGDDTIVGTTISTGANGVCNTGACGDDDQVIEPNKGKPNQICVSPGTNTKRDTNTSGDDGVSGENIHTGADGICDTTADSTDDESTDPFSASTLKDFLNDKVYNQAVVKWNQVDRLTAMDVNFDLNRDGYIDVSTWKTAEMDVVINECKDDNYDYNIFFVDNPSTGSLGFADFGQRYAFVFADESPQPLCTSAHELGHAAFSLYHESGLGVSINVMTQGGQYKWRLFNQQWDDIQAKK